MAKLCAEDNIAMTPYSALAGGRLSKAPGETSKRLEEDSYAKFKYDTMSPTPLQVSWPGTTSKRLEIMITTNYIK